MQRKDGLAREVLTKMGVDADAFGCAIKEQLDRSPKFAHDVVQIYTTPRIVQMLEAANAEATRLKDEFVGVEYLLIAIADATDGEAASIMQEFQITKERLYRAFRREFLNRLDDIIVFEPLTEPEILQITDLKIAEVRERMAERRIDLEVTLAARAALAKEGYDPDFGTRPLRQLIERKVENPLAKEMLSGVYTAGDRITVEVASTGAFTFTRDPGAVPEIVDAEPEAVGAR